MIDIKDLMRTWDMVKSGSLDMTLSEGGDVLTMGLDANSAVVDIKDDEKLKEYVPILLMLKDMAEQLQGPGPGVLGKGEGGGAGKAQKARLDEMLDMLGMLRGVANELAASGKTVKVRYKGDDVILIGKGAKSLSLGLLGYNNMQVKRKAIALRLGLIFKDAFR